MKRSILLGLFVCMTSVFLCAQENDNSSSQLDLKDVALRNPDQLGLVIDGNNQFAFNLYQQLKSRKGNLFFSPYSIANGFSMVGLAAKGDTGTEMEKVFQYTITLAPLNGDLNEILSVTPSSKNRGANELLIASGVWLQKDLPIMRSYEQSLKSNYKVNLEPVDFLHEAFNAIRVINQWVSKQTNGKISQLLTNSDITKETQFVITTAIYMRGNWQYPFDLKLTKKTPFFLDAKYSNQVDMMHVSERFPYMANEQVTMIELPYMFQADKGAALAMHVLLPPTVEGIGKLEAEFNVANWMKWRKQFVTKKVHLAFPRFRDDERLDLNHAMSALGMVKAFTPKADFSGITGEKGLFINKAIHKTFIRIDERGTEAAAVTALGMATTAIVVEQPIDMIVDHPFLFLIIDKKTDSIIFMGRVAQP